LQRLFDSLSSQVFSATYEILICATNPSSQDKIAIQLLAPQLPIKILSTGKKNISAARNCGIKNAKGSLIFFIDEDCSLPTNDFLQRVYQFHLRHPQSAGGGYYLNETKKTTHTLDPLYNFICNAWLDSYQDQKKSAPLFLGGCCFYPRQILEQKNILFDEACARAGEEHSFNNLWSQSGHPMILSQDWSVIHSPKTRLTQLLKRSWVQGAMIQKSRWLPDRPLWQLALRGFLKDPHLGAKDVPLLALYGLVGRASALNVRAKSKLLRIQKELQGRKKNESSPSTKKPLLEHQLLQKKKKTSRKQPNTPSTALPQAATQRID
jgi:glycosyltransferase involved in cell wall biosynthesis